MRPQDLRIGNILRDKYTYDNLIVLELTKDRITFDYKTDKKWQSEPIPLTEEWLLKLGFIPDGITPNHFNIQGMVIWKCNDLLMCDKNGTVLKSVHHLQNFYYAINGEELKATL